MFPHLLRALLLFGGLALADFSTISAQIIEFENGGLKYQSLTKNGITIMCARLQTHLQEYAMLQVAISNGSDAYANIKPEDFSFARADGRVVNASTASEVVNEVLERGNHSDLVKLITTYENAIYGIPNMKVQNGYEKRREAALAEGTSGRFKAAAAASAIALIPVRVPPTQSSDGAVFFPIDQKSFATGHVIVHTSVATWEFSPASTQGPITP
jgi:hypothetical protein